MGSNINLSAFKPAIIDGLLSLGYSVMDKQVRADDETTAFQLA